MYQSADPKSSLSRKIDDTERFEIPGASKKESLCIKKIKKEEYVKSKSISNADTVVLKIFSKIVSKLLKTQNKIIPGMRPFLCKFAHLC